MSDMPSSRNGSAITSIPMPTTRRSSQRKSEPLPEAGPKVRQRTCPPEDFGVPVCLFRDDASPTSGICCVASPTTHGSELLKEYRGRRFFRVGGAGRSPRPSENSCPRRPVVITGNMRWSISSRRTKSISVHSMTIPTAVNRCWELPGREPHTRSAWPYPNWQSFATQD
jgi:hypothetical protein